MRSVNAPWAEAWSRLGLWLSLWDARGSMVESLAVSHPFWSALIQASSHCRERFSLLALRSIREGALLEELEGAGLFVIAVPMIYRGQAPSAVLACGVSDRFFDQEHFARFCSVHSLDRLIFERLATGLPRYSPEQLASYRDIMSVNVGVSNENATAHHDVQDLSSHLAQAYEELNLLYRVSNGMALCHKPAAHFEELCNELLAATVVQSFAVVLEPTVMPGSPSIVVRGPLKISSDELLRLYMQVRDRRPNAGHAVVVNDVAADPELAWAAGWLKRFIYYELVHRERDFGGILAINQVQDQDFSSYEIQLINTVVERSATFLENVQLYDDLEQLFVGMLHALVSSIDAKDPYTCGHSQRVAWLSRHIAAKMGLAGERVQRVYLSGLLHDIGKIGIAEVVLGKKGRLTPEEFMEMKRHPEIGARILQNVPHVADIIPGVLHHHERYDGKGYPDGLRGNDVPFLGRIIGLADSFDAITTNRTYRVAQPIVSAAAEIRLCAGTQFDPEFADLVLGEDLSAIYRQMTEFGERRSLPANDVLNG